MISDVIHLCTLNPQVVVLVAKLLQSEFQKPLHICNECVACVKILS